MLKALETDSYGGNYQTKEPWQLCSYYVEKQFTIFQEISSNFFCISL